MKQGFQNRLKYNVLDQNVNSSRIKNHSSFFNLVSRYISDNQVGKETLRKLSITQAKIIQILLILYILILIYLLNKWKVVKS